MRFRDWPLNQFFISNFCRLETNQRHHHHRRRRRRRRHRRRRRRRVPTLVVRGRFNGALVIPHFTYYR